MDAKTISKALGTLALAAVTAWAGYLWAGARQAEKVESDVRVLQVQLQGELALVRAEQARTREDIQKLAKAVEDLSARKR